MGEGLRSLAKGVSGLADKLDDLVESQGEEKPRAKTPPKRTSQRPRRAPKKKAASKPAFGFLQTLLDIRYAGKTMIELKKAAVISWAKIRGIPVKRIKIDTKKWNPGGVASGSPPM